MHARTDNVDDRIEYDNYVCTARIGTIEELLTQSQIEGVIDDIPSLERVGEYPLPEIGRENLDEFTFNVQEVENSQPIHIVIDLNENTLNIMDAE